MIRSVNEQGAPNEYKIYKRSKDCKVIGIIPFIKLRQQLSDVQVADFIMKCTADVYVCENVSIYHTINIRLVQLEIHTTAPFSQQSLLVQSAAIDVTPLQDINNICI